MIQKVIKSVIAAAAALALCFVIAGCNDSSNSPPAGVQPQSTEGRQPIQGSGGSDSLKDEMKQSGAGTQPPPARRPAPTGDGG